MELLLVLARIGLKMDNNTTLAKYYEPYCVQTIVIFPIIWTHYENGDWFILRTFDGSST